MVSKCANPQCSTPFRYFRDGKLFQVDAVDNREISPPGPQIIPRKQAHHVEHYWLCGICSATMTLAYDPAKGVVTVPAQNFYVRKAAAS